MTSSSIDNNYNNSNNETTNFQLKSNVASVPSLKPPDDPYSAVGKATLPQQPPKRISWYEQQKQWQAKKQEEIKRKQEEKSKREIESLTFKPSLNRKKTNKILSRGYSREKVSDSKVLRYMSPQKKQEAVSKVIQEAKEQNKIKDVPKKVAKKKFVVEKPQAKLQPSPRQINRK